MCCAFMGRSGRAALERMIIILMNDIKNDQRMAKKKL